MTTPTTPAADAPDNLVERLTDEADLCINDGADDIAKLLMSAASRIVNLTERERRCPTMEEAEARALLRGLMGCADEMGLSHESSPAAVVDALQCLKRRHAQMMLSAEAQADERESALVAERDALRAAMDHIAKTCLASRSQSRRIRWIEARARGALLGQNDLHRMIDLPKDGGPATAEKLQRRIVHERHMHNITNGLTAGILGAALAAPAVEGE